MAKSSRRGVAVQVYLDPQLRARLEAAARAGRRPLSEEIRIALEKHLAEVNGASPPPVPPPVPPAPTPAPEPAAPAPPEVKGKGKGRGKRGKGGEG